MKWPPGFEPDRSPVFAHNEITIAAPPERVWRRLIRAAGWPGWYTNSSNLTFLSAGPPDLAPGFGFDGRRSARRSPAACLCSSHRANSAGTRAGCSPRYHGWLIEPEGAGCRVITEETQNGIVPTLAWWYLSSMLKRGHPNWIEGLKSKAEAGEP